MPEAAHASPRRESDTIGRVRLPHDDAGAGPTVVLLHAGIADRTMWAEQLAPIAAAGHRVIAMDLPGFGEAPAGHEDTPWNDVFETLDALSVDRCTLVGNSFGGAVALRVAVVAPRRVAAMVLVSAPPPDLDPSAALRVRKHLEHAFQKLEVSTRTGAVARAAELRTVRRDG